MYELHDMEPTSSDYEIISKCFKGTMNMGRPAIDKIYRVEKRHQKCVEKSDNLMLFHGTSLDSAVGIVNNGFKRSVDGLLGPGVYHTSSSSVATGYSEMKNCYNKDSRDKLLCVFVNEIIQSEELQVFKKVDRAKASKRHFKTCVRWKVYEGSKKTYESDGNGRRIMSSLATRADDHNHFVCDVDYVAPRYFIQFYCNKARLC